MADQTTVSEIRRLRKALRNIQELTGLLHYEGLDPDLVADTIVEIQRICNRVLEDAR